MQIANNFASGKGLKIVALGGAVKYFWSSKKQQKAK